MYNFTWHFLNTELSSLILRPWVYYRISIPHDTLHTQVLDYSKIVLFNGQESNGYGRACLQTRTPQHRVCLPPFNCLIQFLYPLGKFHKKKPASFHSLVRNVLFLLNDIQHYNVCDNYFDDVYSCDFEWSCRLETAAKQMEDSNCIDLESVYQCSENSIAIIQQLVSLERNPLRQV